MVALSVSVSEAVWVPVADGVKVTATVHICPGDRLLQLLVWENSELSVPVTAMLLNVTVTFSWFVTVIFLGALVVPTV